MLTHMWICKLLMYGGRYVEVGEEHGARLFYYFIESERNPAEDPLILWITGGPGCSALSGLLFEIGQYNMPC
jgi:serine carboxypeptidase-like clade I